MPVTRVVGKLQVLRGDPDDDPARCSYNPNKLFHYHTGRTESVVDTVFAADNGLPDVRGSAPEVEVHWPELLAPSSVGWRVYRWVRFRNIVPPPAAPRGLPRMPDGIPDFLFRIAFIVVPAIRLPRPLLGLRDMHRFFRVASGPVADPDTYLFIARRGDDGRWPSATDDGPGVRPSV